MAGNVNSIPKAPYPKRFVWPLTGVFIGFLVAMIPIAGGISLQTGTATWLLALLLVLLLSADSVGARVGAVAAGVFMAIPCFVEAPPLCRGLLMCLMAMPLAAAGALVVVPPMAGLRERLAFLLTWCGTRHVKRCPRRFDAALLLQLAAATVVFAFAVAIVKTASADGAWPPVRWLAGGIMIMAFAEMATAALPLVTTAFGITVPPLMQSPYRSESISEFWNRRWNPFASQMVFRPLCFAPLARRPGVALFAAFGVSGLGHTLLAYMATVRWGISLACGAFFLVQPLLIGAERRLKVRRWPPAIGRAWTMAALAVASPLFVEPALQIVEKSWGPPNSILPPVIAALGFVILFSVSVALAVFAAQPAFEEKPGVVTA